MKKTTVFITTLILLVSNHIFAHNIQLNQLLPEVTVSKDGELIINDEQINYRPWSSDTLNGKVRVLQHIAGRTTVKEKNIALMASIKQAKLDHNNYQTTNIINADDAIFGTSIFVKNSTEKAKLENPHSQIVLDQQSAVKKAWGLKPKESLIVVLDKAGKVRYVSEGKLTPEDINNVLALVKDLLK